MGKCKFDYDSYDTTEWYINPYNIGQISEVGKCNILDSLLEPVEYAGSLILEQRKDCSQKQSCRLIREVTLGKLYGGKSMSVKAPESVCNFHTHPLICYTGEYEKNKRDQLEARCIWGWPSGEDIRECIVFNRKGNEMHLVFALEGAYLIHVNPYITDLIMDDIDKNVAGMVISIIENKFQYTHEFRSYDYNKLLGRNIITPQDWITFINNFRLENFFATKNSCSKKLPCSGVPNVQNRTLKWTHFLQDVNPYVVTDSGNIRFGSAHNNKHTQIIDDNIHDVIKKVNKIKAPGWKKGEWFKVQLVDNIINGHTISQLIRKKPTTEQLYKVWTDFGKGKTTIQFADRDVPFFTPKLMSVSGCKT